MAPVCATRQSSNNASSNVSNNVSTTKSDGPRRPVSQAEWDAVVSSANKKPASTASSAASTQDSETESPPTPPVTPPRTSLKSLQSKATMFVPTEEMTMMFPPPAPCMPTLGKDCLAGVIHHTLGAELWNLNMFDVAMYTGEWSTVIEITIPALSASSCHMVASHNAAEIDAATQKNHTGAVKALRKSIQNLGANWVIQDGNQSAHLCVEFCAADRTRLCRDFSLYGCCHRGDACRWQHAMLETFMINFIMAPLMGHQDYVGATPSRPSQQTVTKHEEAAPATSGRWVPTRPPRPPVEETTTSLAPSSPKRETPAEPVKAGWRPLKELPKDTRPKNPKLVSQRRWSDFVDESDEDSA